MPIPIQGKSITFDKTISLGNIISIATILGGIALGYAKLDNRVTAIEAATLVEEKTKAASQASEVMQRQELRQDLREIRSKLDNLASSGRSASK